MNTIEKYVRGNSLAVASNGRRDLALTPSFDPNLHDLAIRSGFKQPEYLWPTGRGYWFVYERQSILPPILPNHDYCSLARYLSMDEEMETAVLRVSGTFFRREQFAEDLNVLTRFIENPAYLYNSNQQRWSTLLKFASGAALGMALSRVDTASINTTGSNFNLGLILGVILGISAMGYFEQQYEESIYKSSIKQISYPEQYLAGSKALNTLLSYKPG